MASKSIKNMQKLSPKRGAFIIEFNPANRKKPSQDVEELIRNSVSPSEKAKRNVEAFYRNHPIEDFVKDYDFLIEGADEAF